MKLDITYFAIKGVFGDLLGKGIYEVRQMAMLDHDRMTRQAEMQFKAAEASGDPVKTDELNAEYQRIKAAKIIEVCVYETSPVLPVTHFAEEGISEPARIGPEFTLSAEGQETLAEVIQSSPAPTEEMKELMAPEPKKKRTRKKKESTE